MEEWLFNVSLEVVKCIKEERYDVLEEQKCLEKISKEYIKNILKDYGGVLDVVNYEEYIKYFQYVKINNEEKFITYLDLIIDGERSDLTIICEIDVKNCDDIKVVVDDIHIL